MIPAAMCVSYFARAHRYGPSKGDALHATEMGMRSEQPLHSVVESRGSAPSTRAKKDTTCARLSLCPNQMPDRMAGQG